MGFENPPYFSRLFKKELGLTPIAYKEQFLN
ncbi:AraC family transcriptional regulator [Flavobacterium pectinovorum]|nr:AraC family transcriptional regulator [Flavobacterium pectinovorum]WKL49261.1 AraC family transcriptional regulator [Flavobacterium pectinovorum]